LSLPRAIPIYFPLALTLGLLRRGESIGVFQLEGGPMRALMKSLAPTSFDDVAALVKLYGAFEDGGDKRSKVFANEALATWLFYQPFWLAAMKTMTGHAV